EFASAAAHPGVQVPLGRLKGGKSAGAETRRHAQAVAPPVGLGGQGKVRDARGTPEDPRWKPVLRAFHENFHGVETEPEVALFADSGKQKGEAVLRRGRDAVAYPRAAPAHLRLRPHPGEATRVGTELAAHRLRSGAAP